MTYGVADGFVVW